MGRYSLPGLTVSSLKTHFALTPLLFLGGLCSVVGVSYLLRIGINHPEISWAPSTNQQPWNKLDQTYKYRLHSPQRDYEAMTWPEGRPTLSKE